MRADRAFAHVPLHRLRQLGHEPESAAHPAFRPPKALRELRAAELEPFAQLTQKPSLLERAVRLARAHHSLQEQRIRLAQRPRRRPHRVLPQLAQQAHPLVAVDHDMDQRLCRAHHHDGRLLPDLRQRRQETPLPRRVPAA